jgi:hypothetical protein
MPNTDHRDSDGRDRERQRVETSDAAKLVRTEIVALHEFFVQWFSGAVANDDDVFAQGFARRLDPGFVLIGPDAEIMPLAMLTKFLRAAHGSNPGFRIEIRNVVLRRELDSVFVVTYEEWQRNAVHAPPSNGRLSTALLQTDRVAPGGLAWLHLHECWLPSAAVAAEPFEF